MSKYIKRKKHLKDIYQNKFSLECHYTSHNILMLTTYIG